VVLVASVIVILICAGVGAINIWQGNVREARQAEQLRHSQDENAKLQKRADELDALARRTSEERRHTQNQLGDVQRDLAQAQNNLNAARQQTATAQQLADAERRRAEQAEKQLADARTIPPAKQAEPAKPATPATPPPPISVKKDVNPFDPAAKPPSKSGGK
jgi:hypothetical protein